MVCVACAAVASLVDPEYMVDPVNDQHGDPRRNAVFEALSRPPFRPNLQYMQQKSIREALKSDRGMISALMSVLASVLTAPLSDPDITSVGYHNEHFTEFLWDAFASLDGPLTPSDQVELQVLRNGNFNILLNSKWSNSKSATRKCPTQRISTPSCSNGVASWANGRNGFKRAQVRIG